MNSTVYCKICEMAFVNTDELNHHIDLVHTKSLLQCQSCNKVFKDETEFKNHMQIHFRHLDSDVSGD